MLSCCDVFNFHLIFCYLKFRYTVDKDGNFHINREEGADMPEIRRKPMAEQKIAYMIDSNPEVELASIILILSKLSLNTTTRTGSRRDSGRRRVRTFMNLASRFKLLQWFQSIFRPLHAQEGQTIQATHLSAEEYRTSGFLGLSSKKISISRYRPNSSSLRRSVVSGQFTSRSIVELLC